MDIEFDPEKNAANLAKHGVSLAHGVKVFEDAAHLILSSARAVDGEDRQKVIGDVEGRLWTAVYVMRGPVARFISVRKSNGKEAEYYNSDPG